VFGLDFQQVAASLETKIYMPSEDASPVLKCANIVASPKGLAEADGKKVVLFVPKAEVNRIVLKYGKAEHRPLVALSIGLVLTLLGLSGVAELFMSTGGLRYKLGMIFFGLVGGSLIYDATKQRYFLEVHKTKGDCRLVFSRQASLKDVQDFCEKVRNEYKYDISEVL
jgi:hypothetical protein